MERIYLLLRLGQEVALKSVVLPCGGELCGCGYFVMSKVQIQKKLSESPKIILYPTTLPSESPKTLNLAIKGRSIIFQLSALSFGFGAEGSFNMK